MRVQVDGQRAEDAGRHDEVMVMIGDPETGRPLMTLSVTRDGTPVVEADSDADLAAGIRALNGLLSRSLVAAGQHGIRSA